MSTEIEAPEKPLRGRPRKLKSAEDVIVPEPKAAKVSGSDIKPYTTSKDLPPADIEYRRGKRKVKAGEPRYATHTVGNVVEVVAIYRSGKGVSQKLVRALKPAHKPHDRAMLTKLRKAGVPEI